MIPKHYLSVLTLIYITILLGLLFLTVHSLFRDGNPTVGLAGSGDIGVYMVPLIAMIGYFGGNFIFNRTLINIKNKDDVTQKSISYIRVAALRYGFLGLPALIGILTYRENNNIFYLVIVASLILYLFKLRPSRKKMIGDLDL